MYCYKGLKPWAAFTLSEEGAEAKEMLVSCLKAFIRKAHILRGSK